MRLFQSLQQIQCKAKGWAEYVAGRNKVNIGYWLEQSIDVL